MTTKRRYYLLTAALLLMLGTLLPGCGGHDGDGDLTPLKQSFTDRLAAEAGPVLSPEGDGAELFALALTPYPEVEGALDSLDGLNVTAKRVKDDWRVSVSSTQPLAAMGELRLLYDDARLACQSTLFSPSFEHAHLGLFSTRRPGEIPAVFYRTSDTSVSAEIFDIYFSTGADDRRLTELEIPEPEHFGFYRDFGKRALYFHSRLPGDFNGDGSADGLDLFMLGARFQQSSGLADTTEQTPGNRCVDANADGTLNGLDLFSLSASFQSCISGYNIYKSVNSRGWSLAFSESRATTLPHGLCGEQAYIVDEDDFFDDVAYYVSAYDDVNGIESDITPVRYGTWEFFNLDKQTTGADDLLLTEPGGLSLKVPAAAAAPDEEINIRHVLNFRWNAALDDPLPILGRMYSYGRELDGDFDAPVIVTIPLLPREIGDLEVREIGLAYYDDDENGWNLVHSSEYGVDQFPDGSARFIWPTTARYRLFCLIDQGPLRASFRHEKFIDGAMTRLRVSVDARGGWFPYNHTYAEVTNLATGYDSNIYTVGTLNPGMNEVVPWVRDREYNEVSGDPEFFEVDIRERVEHVLDGGGGASLHSGVVQTADGVKHLVWHEGFGDNTIRLATNDGGGWTNSVIGTLPLDRQLLAIGISEFGTPGYVALDPAPQKITFGAYRDESWQYDEFDTGPAGNEKACLAWDSQGNPGFAWTSGSGTTLNCSVFVDGIEWQTHQIATGELLSINPGSMSFNALDRPGISFYDGLNRGDWWFAQRYSPIWAVNVVAEDFVCSGWTLLGYNPLYDYPRLVAIGGGEDCDDYG